MTTDQISRLTGLIEDAIRLGSRAVHVWGTESQERMAAEECGELIAALMQAHRGRQADVPGEVADVLITAVQLVTMNAESCIEAMGAKLARLEGRLRSEMVRVSKP